MELSSVSVLWLGEVKSSGAVVEARRGKSVVMKSVKTGFIREVDAEKI